MYTLPPSSPTSNKQMDKAVLHENVSSPPLSLSLPPFPSLSLPQFTDVIKRMLHNASELDFYDIMARSRNFTAVSTVYMHQSTATRSPAIDFSCWSDPRFEPDRLVININARKVRRSEGHIIYHFTHYEYTLGTKMVGALFLYRFNVFRRFSMYASAEFLKEKVKRTASGTFLTGGRKEMLKIVQSGHHKVAWKSHTWLEAATRPNPNGTQSALEKKQWSTDCWFTDISVSTLTEARAIYGN